MDRRTFLRATAAGATGTLAGCGLLRTRSARTPPVPDSRPDAVYVPSHADEMVATGTASAGRATVALTYTVPHRFWTVTNREVRKTPVEDADSLHAMAVVWDRETGTQLPDAGLSMEFRRDGTSVAEEVVYPMLSARMGFHYGGNFALPGDGSYAVRVKLGAVGTRRTGGFREAFAEPSTGEITLDYAREERDALEYERFDDAGERGSVEPTAMGALPDPRLPEAQALPGATHGRVRTEDDVVLVVKRLSTTPAGVTGGKSGNDGDGYLAVSARTPYNRLVLPMMTLRATVGDGGRFDGRLEPTLDPDLGYHYGASVAVGAGDPVTLAVELPPQVARHEGYETAFLGRSTVTVGGG